MALSTIQNNSFADTAVHGYRNLLINGGFDIWQRGISFTGGGYTADRWVISTTETGTAITKTANRDNRNTFRVTFGSVISCNVDQRIEAFGNIGDNQQATLSFWVRGSRATTGTDFCRIRNHTTATTLETLTYDITTSWTKVTKTFSANNTWSKDDVARLYLFVAAASSPWVSGDWVEFSDVQLELGSEATPFEHRPYGDELARCQRYYYALTNDGTTTNYMIGGVETSTAAGLGGVTFPNPMRAVPTATLLGTNVTKFYSAATGTDDSVSINANRCSSTIGSLYITGFTGGTVGQVATLYNGGSGSGISFDAEL